MNESLILDSDFNNFYLDFIGKKKKSKESASAEPIPLDWSKGMVVGDYSPNKEPEKKKSRKLSGAGDFITGDRAIKILDGISKGIEVREQFRSSRESSQGGGFENAPNEDDKGLSNKQKIGIAVGVLAVVGLGIYLFTKI